MIGYLQEKSLLLPVIFALLTFMVSAIAYLSALAHVHN